MWKAIDRKQLPYDPNSPPVLTEAMREKIRSFFPRYETKRAVLLPALHIVQESLGYISYQAMVEVAELLEIPPSAVFDTVSFYTHFWTHPRGRKTIVVCRGLTCELMGGRELLEALKRELGIDEHETTADGEYSLMSEECLARCEQAPCLLINEKTHGCVRAAEVRRLLDDPDNDRLDIERSDLYDGVAEAGRPAGAAAPTLRSGNSS